MVLLNPGQNRLKPLHYNATGRGWIWCGSSGVGSGQAESGQAESSVVGLSRGRAEMVGRAWLGVVETGRGWVGIGLSHVRYGPGTGCYLA